MKILQQSNPAKDEIGDILYGEEFIAGWWNEKKYGNYKWILLDLISNDNWLALKKLGIDIKIREEFIYECAWIKGNKYYWFCPLILISKDNIDKYKKEELGEVAFDQDWVNHMYKSYKLKPSKINKTMLGHGYTDGTLPSDGSGETKLALLEIDNGDYIVGHIWVWFNK